MRSLSSKDITAFLRSAPVQFVLANVGEKPRWIELTDCYDFWKRKLKPHLCDAGSPAILDRCPDAYCYFGSEWSTSEGAPAIVVLEKAH